MRVNKQAITRSLKKLFGSNLPRQLEANNAEIPPPSFEIGDPVKIIGTKKNSARRGKIREHIWHHKNTEWMYFINEEGRKVSKRYREDELEPDHENLPVGPLSDVTTKKLTPSGSLVEAYEFFLEIDFTEQERKQIVNPLGTEFDLADVFVGHSKEQWSARHSCILGRMKCLKNSLARKAYGSQQTLKTSSWNLQTPRNMFRLIRIGLCFFQSRIN